MENMFKSGSYWIIALLIAAIVFAIGINMKVEYVSESKILITPKSEKISENFDQVVENTKQIPHFLTFYDSLEKDNPGIGKHISITFSKKRLDYWNSKVETKRLDNSGIIILNVYENSPVLADSLGKAITKNFVFSISKYYNIKDDIDVRIVDGPAIYSKSRANIPFWIVTGLFIGLIAGAFFTSLKQILSNKEIRSSAIPQSYPYVETVEAPVLSDAIKEDAKSSVPLNLPTSEEPKIIFKDEDINIRENGENGYREPSDEEVRRKLNVLLKKEVDPNEVRNRLNDLLKGNMQ